MNTKLQLSGILAIMALIFNSSTLIAQVKIGTNPTTINAANNLEVEASTAGRKVSIDKTTGKVTIADGSEGVDKVLTSNATGVATWQQAIPNIKSIVSVTGLANQYLGAPTTYTTADWVAEVIDKNNDFNLVTNTFTVPVDGAGYYSFSAMFWTLPLAVPVGANLYLFVNGVNRGTIAGAHASGIFQSGVNSTASAHAAGSAIVLLSPGDAVTTVYQDSFDNAYISYSKLDIIMVSK
jgi:hypothetical protein